MHLMKSYSVKLKDLFSNDEAATAAEYGILAALVAVAIIGAVTTFGGALSSMFSSLTKSVTPAK